MMEVFIFFSLIVFASVIALICEKKREARFLYREGLFIQEDVLEKNREIKYIQSEGFSKEEICIKNAVTKLRKIWSEVNEDKLPKWIFDEVTSKQLDYLSHLGIEITFGTITKGQASDLIGLFHEENDYQFEILNFFRKYKGPTNQTFAKYVVDELMSNESNRKAWENRPILMINKEFLRFFGAKNPKNITMKKFLELRLNIEQKVSQEKLDQWQAFEDGWGDLSCSEVRSDYGIKKISMARYRTGWEKLASDGMGGTEDITLDKICDVLIDMYPQLRRKSSEDSLRDDTVF